MVLVATWLKVCICKTYDIYAVRNVSFDVFLTVHNSIDFSKYQLNAQFFYS